MLFNVSNIFHYEKFNGWELHPTAYQRAKLASLEKNSARWQGNGRSGTFTREAFADEACIGLRLPPLIDRFEWTLAMTQVCSSCWDMTSRSISHISL